MTLNQTDISTCKPANEQRNRTLAEAEDEIRFLYEEIQSLLQYSSEQLQHQQEIEAELKATRREIARMNRENQQLFEAKLLFLRELKKIATALPLDQGISGEALLKLLSRFYDEIEPFEALMAQIESQRK